MDDHVPLACDSTLTLPSSISTSEYLSTKTLASLRSLIIDPLTPAPQITSIAETLTGSRHDHRSIKLLSDLAALHSHISPLVSHSLRISLSAADSTRAAAESLDALASIAEGNGSPPLLIDDALFASLCFRPSAVRPWLLRNAERFGVKPYLLCSLFLGFTKDPYPYVRKESLDGLVRLSKTGVIEDGDVIRGCYFRAVELLNDVVDCVIISAIQAVLAWGLKLVACHSDSETKAYWSDEAFVKICSVVRDRRMEVRVGAFEALGKIQMVSEDILLQTLSTKVLASSNEQLKISGSDVAGAFVHGVEDDFYEVQKAACNSLGTLVILSPKFAGIALNQLVNILNDGSMLVRLQAFDSILSMASFGLLKVQEKHMDTILRTLADSNTLTRSAARKILKLSKLPDLRFFNSTIKALQQNLELFPQDEADVLNALFHIGRNHGKFVDRYVKKVSLQMEPVSYGKLGFDSVMIAANLVLAISAPLPQEIDCSFPPNIFSYAVTHLGRISHALSDIMHQNDLLNYLLQRSRSSGQYDIEFYFRERGITGSTAMPWPQKGGGTSESISPIAKEPRVVGTSLVEYKSDVHDAVTMSMNVILAKVKDIWPFVQSGFVNEVLRTLRSCREELATFMSASIASAGAFAFTKKYIKIMKLLVKAWVSVLPSRHFPACWMGELDFVLRKLDARLSELKSTFINFTNEEELHILELIMLMCTLKLSTVEICCHIDTLRKLSRIMAHVQSILQEGTTEPSAFVIEVGKLSSEIGTSLNTSSCNPILFRRVLESFTLKQLAMSGRLKLIKADLDIPDNDYEHPLHFVAGLPVGIPCHIALHNVLVESRLWIKMRANGTEDTQFVYLDLDFFGGCDDLRTFKFSAPFYQAPKAFSFTVSVCICMERFCKDQDVPFTKRPGPRHELTSLCKEKNVFLSMVM